MLEALFGPEDGREITYRISHRIAFFLDTTAEDRRAAAKVVKDAYATRSKVVHGGKLAGLTPEQSVELMKQCEQLIRRSFRKLAKAPEIAAAFDSRKREMYLDGLAFEA